MMGHDMEADLCKIYTRATSDEWRSLYAKYASGLSFKLPEITQKKP
jgi:hypothetical protein